MPEPVPGPDPSEPEPEPGPGPGPRPGPGPDDGGAPDAASAADALATDRLRSLLRSPEPAGDRVRGLLAAVPLPALPTGAAHGRAVAVAVVGLGLAAVVGFVAVRGGSAPLDPVAVLPRAQPAGAAGAAGAAGGAGADPSAGPRSAPVGVADGAPAAGGGAGGGPAGSAPPGTAAARIRVHAAGAVAQPGVHELATGARIEDLIAAAGGLAADADPDRVNLAAPVADGERVYIPLRGEADAPPVVAGGTAAAPPAAAPGGDPGGRPAEGSGTPERVDLNRAGAAELDALPGIGPATADAIIRHRDQHGPFTSVDQLQDVTGIGPAKLARLRDLVRV